MRLRLAAIVQSAVSPALALLPGSMDSLEARIELLAIGLQESRFVYRVQLLNDGGRGPAHGLWQFERGGGVKGIYYHEATRHWLAALCQARSCAFGIEAVWNALETDDVLAAGCARLLLLTDMHALPAANDAQAGWDCYERTWRPGKPHRETWDGFHALARAEATS